MKTAATIKARVENLLAAALGKHAIDGDTAAWVGGLDSKLYDKLAAVGLVPRREPKPDEAQPEGATLAGFIKQYIAARPGMKPNTLKNYRQTERSLVDFFGPDRLLTEITRRRLRRLESPPGSQGPRPGDHRPQRETGAAILPGGGSQETTCR